MTDAQLELGFGHLRNQSVHDGSRRSASNTRRWWFERMREIVDRARDWQPAPPPRPEQSSFGPMYRQVAIAAVAAIGGNAGREEHLVCE